MEPSSFHKAKYGSWAGDPSGHAPDPEKCAKEIMDSTSGRFFQCSRRRTSGPENAFCKQHAKRYDEAAQ